MRLNNIDPTFRTNRGSPIPIAQIGWWAPRIEAGGPLIKGRLFLEQTAQYRYSAGDVPSLPQDVLRISEWFSSFTRVDANLSPRHTLVATGGVFPSVFHSATLGTFTPPDATVDLRVHGHQTSVTERVTWTDTLFGETTVQAHDYQTDVAPQGSAPMQLLPETTLGNFFNQQHRDTGTYQVIEAVSGSHVGFGGAAPVQVRRRSAAQPVRRREREPAGADRADRRHAGAPAGFLRADACSRSAAPTWRCSCRIGFSRTRAGRRSSAGGSIATASPSGST